MSRLNVLAFADLYIYNYGVFMYKVNHNIPSDIICKMFTKLSSLHSLARHSLNDFYLPQVRLDTCKHCISYNGVQHWFQLSNNLKDTNLFSMFKSKLFVQLISTY